MAIQPVDERINLAEYARPLAIYQGSFDDIQLADRKERVIALSGLYVKIPDIRVALKSPPFRMDLNPGQIAGKGFCTTATRKPMRPSTTPTGVRSALDATVSRTSCALPMA